MRPLCPFPVRQLSQAYGRDCFGVHYNESAYDAIRQHQVVALIGGRGICARSHCILQALSLALDVNGERTDACDVIGVVAFRNGLQ